MTPHQPAFRQSRSPEEHLRDLFQQRGGYLTTHEAAREGIAGAHLSRLARQGEIERVQRGVYRHSAAEAPFSPTMEQLLEVQLRVPFARPCLLSALDLHGLTTTVPDAVHVAIPRNRQFPQLTHPPVQVHYFNPRTYQHGVQTIRAHGRELVTYTPAKTLADLLGYADRYGRDLYLEGLRKYLRQKGSVRELLDAARVNRVERVMNHDLEVLGHDRDH